MVSYYLPSETERLGVQVTTTQGSVGLKTLVIDDTLDTQDGTSKVPSWTYVVNMVGDSENRTSAALVPTQAGLSSALDHYAHSIYPEVRFDQGRIASDFMKAFKISKNTQEGLTRTLKSSCGSVSPLQICIKPHWRPLYLLELEIITYCPGEPKLISYRTCSVASMPRSMQIDGEEYIGSQPTCMGLVGLCTGILEPSAVDSMISKLNKWEPKWKMEASRKSTRLVIGTEVPVIHKDGSFAFDTVVCKIVEPTEDELELVPMLQ